MIGNIAVAYARRGNSQKIDETGADIRTGFEKMLAEGLNEFSIVMGPATHRVLVGDLDKALKRLSA